MTGRLHRMTILLAALAAGAGLLAACGGDDDDASAESTTSSSTTTTVLDTTGFATFDWLAPQPLAVGGGWTIADCPAEGRELCLTNEDGRYAKVEHVRLAAPADRDLNVHAAKFLEDFTKDRTQGCGKGYRVVPDPTNAMIFGDGAGIRYGFSGGAGGSAGVITERTVQWAGIRGDLLAIVTISAYDPGSCISPPGEGTLAELEELLPALDELMILAGLPKG